MRRPVPFLLALSVSAALLLGCGTDSTLEPVAAPGEASAAKPVAELITMTRLPRLKGGAHGEARAVSASGLVVGGYSYGRQDVMYAARWTFANGAWTITALPHASTAAGAFGRGVAANGDVVGNDWPGTSPHPVLWPSTGGFTVLGCPGELGQAHAVSDDGRVSVGTSHGVSPARASVWRPADCREDLPPLIEGTGATASATNSDGTIIGGNSMSLAYGVAVRWTHVAGQWQVEQLDSRPSSVRGANSLGDMTGVIHVCGVVNSNCARAAIWYADGTSRILDGVDGENSSAYDINSAGEVVGMAGSSPFFWTPAAGASALPAEGGAVPFALSDVRQDGTRVVVGAGGNPFGALVWVVRGS
jgi:uncharacterized membrane protein